MKTKTNIALEGTCSGDVVGGLYREPREHLQAFSFGKGGTMTEKPQGVDEFYKLFFEALQVMTDEQKQELEAFLSKLISGKGV